MTFDVIMADPPWPYDSPRALVGNGGRGSDGGKAAAIIQADVGQHYDVMTVKQIKALSVAGLASKNALLFLWITNPFLAAGIGTEVARAWSFKPFTVVTWAKIKRDVPLIEPSMKTGHWFRSASEQSSSARAARSRAPRTGLRCRRGCRRARSRGRLARRTPSSRTCSMRARRQPYPVGTTWSCSRVALARGGPCGATRSSQTYGCVRTGERLTRCPCAPRTGK